MLLQWLSLLLYLISTSNVRARSVRKFGGEVVQGSYIIKVKDGLNPLDVASLAGHDSIDALSGNGEESVFNGFRANLNEEQLNHLLNSTNVDYIEEDGVMFAPEFSDSLSRRAPVSQTNAPWNLARLSQEVPATNPPFTYFYSAAAGENVDVYILDTGIAITHPEFGGRASWGATFGGYPDADGNGHGTHIAGIVAGKTYGVAKLANVVAVKVLSDAGSGSISDIISGLSWVVQNAKTAGRSSVILLALGGGVSTSLDSAVVSVINSGITVVVVAGGSNTDASGSSPARVAQAITVAASTQADGAASFSNWGSVIDLYAPGQNIISAVPGGSTPGTATFSGVSMAGAHVAGLAAYVLSLTGPISPGVLAGDLITMSLKDILTGVPAGTPNRLANNDVSKIGITI